MQPLEVIQQALLRAPGDVDRFLAQYINSTPPNKREGMYASIVRAAKHSRLTGELTEPFKIPRIFMAEAAEQVWEDLQGELEESDINATAPFFRHPDDVYFTPVAYPGRWSPSLWNFPLTPEEVRRELGITDADAEALRTIALELINRSNCDDKERRNEEIERSSSVKFLRRPQDNGALKIAVLPYVDTLPMVTLLYAVSDAVDGLAFCPATFYPSTDTRSGSLPIDRGGFDAGYATASQIETIRLSRKFTVSEVFERSFARSFLVRIKSTPGARCTLSHISFVGSLGAFPRVSLEPISAQERRFTAFLHGQHSSEITEKFDLMVNWEIPLILSFSAGANRYLDDGVAGMAVTISTDAHLWAASFGLNLSADMPKSENSSQSIIGATGREIDQHGHALEDNSAKLCWFIPGGNGQADGLHQRLHHLVDKIIIWRVREELYGHEESSAENGPNTVRENLVPVAHCLLAPLLTAFPSYRGPLLATPPEVSLKKLMGADSHMGYRPHWFAHRHQKEAVASKEVPSAAPYQQQGA